MKDSQQLVKQENKVATYQEWFKKDKDKLVEFLQKDHELTGEQALEVISNPQAWAEFLGLMKKSLDVHKIRLIKKAQTQTEEALNQKRLGQAFDGAKTASLLGDKTFGEAHRPAAALNFYGRTGEQVSVKINFDFKAHQKNKWEEPRKIIEGEVEEDGK